MAAAQTRHQVETPAHSLAYLEATNWVGLNGHLEKLRQDFNIDNYRPEPAREPQPDECRIIVSDLHGRFHTLYRLLLAAGAINEDGSKNDGYWVCQIGDLTEGTSDSVRRDAASTLLSPGWIDCQVIGNHELPFIAPSLDISFGGALPKMEAETQMRFNKNLRAGHYRVALEVDGWLISHAGADPRLIDATQSPEQLAIEIEDRFVDRLIGDKKDDALIDVVGKARGGSSALGSVFWNDFTDLAHAYHDNPQARSLKQIVGHTRQEKEPVCYYGSLWPTDMVGTDSGGLAALVKNGAAAEKWEPLVLERSPLPGNLS